MSDITRRDFLKLLQGAGALVGVGVIAAPVAAYFYPPKLVDIPTEPVLVCPEADLPVGQAKMVEFGRYPAIIINTPEGLKAYSSVCTHFACLVKWNPDTARLECPCHEGYFSVTDGSVISGPPPKPLMILATEVVDGQIYVKAGG
jgi:nitrite reductase/ring-hydroxylating ferredoxin subunit